MQVVKTDPATGDAIREFEPAKRAMTIRDLLRNTSGLVYGMGDYADPDLEMRRYTCFTV
jgi:CubicO group peptidase (beta-lactamase class C family)